MEYLSNIMTQQVIRLSMIEICIMSIFAYAAGYQIAKRKFRLCSNASQKRQIAQSTIIQKENASIPVICQEIYEDKCIQTEPQQQSDCANIPSAQILPFQPIKETLQSKYDNLPSQLLKQKVELQFKKLQSTSFFQTRLEPSKDTKYMRKIQKHEIVTDFQLQNSSVNITSLLPYQNNPITALSQPHSLLEAVAFQDYNMKIPSPYFERKFISISKLDEKWRESIIAPWILENGRFDKSYIHNKLIGQGSFGRVYQAENLLQGNKYAIKKLVMKGMVKIGELMNEVFIISKYNHPNIVSYYSCWIQLATIDEATMISSIMPAKNDFVNSTAKVEKQMLYCESNSGFTFEKSSKNSRVKSIKKSQLNKVQAQMVPYGKGKQSNISFIHIYTLHIQMQLCQNSLHSYLRSRKTIDYQQSFNIFEQIIYGLNFLHSNGIIHRDLKPANILLCEKSKLVKIGDFGLAALVENHHQIICQQRVGTPLYMAPQVKCGKIQTSKLDLIDVYSVGVIYFQLLQQLTDMTHHERNEKIMSLQINKVQISAKELKQQKKMIKLLTKTNNRPSIRQILQSKQLSQLRKKYISEYKYDTK